MKIIYLPMFISGILCTLLAVVTWMFRRRERINRVFSFFTLTLAVDAFAFFTWFQYGNVAHIRTWMRFTFTAGFLVPFALIIFFFAFTGYDKNLDAKVLRIKVRYFRIFSLSFILACMLLSQLTDLIVKPSEAPEHIWDVEFGTIGNSLFLLYAFIFTYLFSMAIKSYRTTNNEPQKRFILLLTAGALAWLLFGYIGVIFFPPSNETWQTSSYLGTATMAVFYFVAIVNYQSDKVHELNIGLERKVAERTQQLQQKNLELEETLGKLQQMQQQVIMQEKMASLGQLVAGLTHEFNTPIGAIRSMKDTKAKAVTRLQTALEKIAPGIVNNDREMSKALSVILKSDQLIDQGTERLHEIVKNLKNFARLDEAETVKADIHEGIDSVLALMKHDCLTNIEVVRDYGEIPPFICQPRKLNQVFLNLLKNACEAIDGRGRITITTRLKENTVSVAISDTGKGIAAAELETIFDPGFTTKGSVVRARLGLSISYQFIQEHHGKITVVSQPGEGSVFTVSLPVVVESPEDKSSG